MSESTKPILTDIYCRIIFNSGSYHPTLHEVHVELNQFFGEQFSYKDGIPDIIRKAYFPVAQIFSSTILYC
jgi:hypothetical protein